MQTESPFNEGYIQIFTICLNKSLIKSQLFNRCNTFLLSVTVVVLSRHAFPEKFFSSLATYYDLCVMTVSDNHGAEQVV